MVNIIEPVKQEFPNLHIDTRLARDILVGFVKSEIERVGFKHAVLGLSGGIDSALSCFLAAEAMGPENVLAVRLPYRLSSQESYDHAQLVIDQLGVQTRTIDISPIADGLINQIPDMNRMRQANIMSRSRMICLYDQSAEFDALVVGTCNKTEILLGYSTLYGDSACAINPIGDLYKTQVRELSRAMGVPDIIIDKAPTADLWAGQTDEGELGFTYAEVDRLLFLLIDERYRPEECIAAGFDADFVHQVIARVQRNHFKRILPPIAKISHRTIGYDYLYLRDWGT
ncbi:MAG TPA: NAD+ synthase [Chloroflexi bacterium]|nr:NAD+ synthase [Chloroflexota bacterium]